MPDENDETARKIANGRSFDGYSAWRMLKDINDQIFDLGRNKSAVPIGLVRLRWLIVRARELRGRLDVGQGPAVDGSRKKVFGRRAGGIEEGFDAFDFVDRYRALGGVRVAWAMGDGIRLGPMEGDTEEASQLWLSVWSKAPTPRREAIMEALMVRGRY